MGLIYAYPTVCKGFLFSSFVVSGVFLYFLSLVTASHVLNAIALLFVTAVSFFVLTRSSGWVFLLYAFGLSFAIASNVLVEMTGAYLIEIREQASLTGSAARNGFLAALFLGVAYAGYNWFLRIIPARVPTLSVAEFIAVRTLLIVGFGATAYLAAVLLTYGSPVLMGIDRFAYITDVAPPGYFLVYANIPLLGFFVALGGYKRILPHAASVAWLLVTIGLYIFAGEKFSRIFLLLFFFLLPYFIIGHDRLRFRHFFLGMVFFVGLGGVVALNYLALYGSAEIFVHRLALQGQMNYAVDGFAGAFGESSVLSHFLGYGAREADRGMVFLMYLVAPPDVVDHRIAHGTTFTAPFPANISYFFGQVLSPLVIACLAMFVGWLAALVKRATASSNAIFSALTIKIFFMAYLAIMMGNMDILVSEKGVLYFLAPVAYLFLVSVFWGRRA